MEGYTIRDLELYLGEDHNKIQKWIASGGFTKAFKARAGITETAMIFTASKRDIISFLKQHPQEINLGKVDQAWFLDLVVLRGAARFSVSASGTP